MKWIIITGTWRITTPQVEKDVREDEEVTFSDALYSFRVNSSNGTLDTINKAQKAGLEIIECKEYVI